MALKTRKKMGNWKILATNERERNYDDDRYYSRREDEAEKAYKEGWEDGYRKAKEEAESEMMGHRRNEPEMDYRRGQSRMYY